MLFGSGLAQSTPPQGLFGSAAHQPRSLNRYRRAGSRMTVTSPCRQESPTVMDSFPEKNIMFGSEYAFRSSMTFFIRADQ